MKRLIALALTLVVIGLACEPAINPPPIPPPITYLFKQIFWSSAVDTLANPPRTEPHSCAVLVEPADGDLRAPYTVVDNYWYPNGWAFWTACVIPARNAGRALPAVKITGDPNDQTLIVFPFHLDNAPIFGRGAGHYSTFQATNIAVWRRSYIEVSG